MGWRHETRDGASAFLPDDAPGDLLVAFSGRGVALPDEPSPTSYLARRFADALGLHALPIVRATQVHGNAAATISEMPALGETRDAGECDALATTRPGVALAVQSADCVPILLAAPGAVGTAHAGWRGSVKNVAGAAVAALGGLGADPASLRVWLGPSIGPCCYEVGGEVAAQFPGDFVRAGGTGGFRLNLAAVNIAQLARAGVPREAISVHPACTKCAGELYASYRRDGERAGRMIALIARLTPGASWLTPG